MLRGTIYFETAARGDGSGCGAELFLFGFLCCVFMFFSSSFFVKRLGGLEYCQATEISSFDVVVVFLWVDQVFSLTEGKKSHDLSACRAGYHSRTPKPIKTHRKQRITREELNSKQTKNAYEGEQPRQGQEGEPMRRE
jgi:hypothetical protein